MIQFKVIPVRVFKPNGNTGYGVYHIEFEIVSTSDLSRYTEVKRGYVEELGGVLTVFERVGVK